MAKENFEQKGFPLKTKGKEDLSPRRGETEKIRVSEKKEKVWCLKHLQPLILGGRAV